MKIRYRPRIRHPFFPGLNPIHAGEAEGCVPTLCGGFAALERAAARGVTAGRAVFVLIKWNAPPLSDEQRDGLWELYQTPVYAILIGQDGRVAGFECEVQSGFHVPLDDGVEHRVVCECGRPGPMVSGNGGYAPGLQPQVEAARAGAA
jgi:hypothetical protein